MLKQGAEVLKVDCIWTTFQLKPQYISKKFIINKLGAQEAVEGGQIVNNSQQPTTIKSVCRSITCCPLEVWAVAEAAGSNSAVLRATCFWSSASSVSDSESELPVDLLLWGRTTTSFGTTSSFFVCSESAWFILKGMATEINKIINYNLDVQLVWKKKT